jgi:hypothetical protein
MATAFLSFFLNIDLPQALANPVVAFLLRAALGSYVVWMARGFYADPLAYFRRWMPRMPELLWMKLLVRYAACFCVWGGCFIVATAVATQIFNLHGTVLAVGLILLAAVATYLLLPKIDDRAGADESGSMGRLE